jgi:ribosome-associated toxin RatA of RatAB toxin-antitoxin module
MPRVWMRCRLADERPDEVLRKVTDFARWPEASESVRSVTVEEQPDGSEITQWEVTFHQGLLRWSERDRIVPEERRATFDLIEGDPHVFEGEWAVEVDGSASVLSFDADFDLGMPSLSHVLDPIAVEAVEDAIASVLRGLYGEQLDIEFTSVAPPRSADARSNQGAV